MSAHVPVIVRARLAAGIAQAAPWGIALDGLLAAELWADHKAAARAAAGDYIRALDQDNPADLDLPLSRCTPDDGPWHWAATCAFPEEPVDRLDVHTWTGRIDHRHLEQTTTALPKVISGRQGRYRTRRMPLLVTPCTSVIWRAIGDPDKIRDLLTQIASIGKKRTSGEGHVLAWEITANPELDTFAAAHLHPDGTLGRPTPPMCLHGQTLTDGGTGRAGIRPPYMHSSRQYLLHLPALLQS